MKFRVTDDRTFECQYVPIYFFWDDCSDNAFASMTGDTLYIDRAIYNYDTTMNYLIWDEEDDAMFPEDARIPFVGAPDYCLNPDPDKPSAVRLIDFWNGGIDIICADSIDARGDINLNGSPNEIADAVLFANYFVYGIGVFTVNTEGQIAASDVNADGLTLSVADLVYLIRVIIGDAVPFTKLGSPVEITYREASGVLSSNGDEELGAAFVMFEGNVKPQLLAEGMDLQFAYDGEFTRALVFSLEGHGFHGDFLQFDGEVVSVELATAAGRPVNALLMPERFDLSQNFPNPFNPTTTIGFSLPEASEYRLVIYNVVGQVVAEFSGQAVAGHHTIDWNADNQASGVYFYRLRAGDNTATRKMLLLK
jgi:hypothetical protein